MGAAPASVKQRVGHCTLQWNESLFNSCRCQPGRPPPSQRLPPIPPQTPRPLSSLSRIPSPGRGRERVQSSEVLTLPSIHPSAQSRRSLRTPLERQTRIGHGWNLDGQGLPGRTAGSARLRAGEGAQHLVCAVDAFGGFMVNAPWI
jgi:hypothetical protein